MYKNYVFDLYGTLIDIRTDEWSKNFYKKYAKWLRRQGYAFEWKRFFIDFKLTEALYRGLPSEYEKPEIQIEDVFREVFNMNGYDPSDEEITYLCENFRKTALISMGLFPDTLSCLEGLKKAGKKIYLLSNAQRSYTWQELECAGIIPYFDGILISSDEKCMKPDPAFYNILCDRYDLKKEECIMIGNELHSDIAGAKKAGMDGFFINRAPVFHEPENIEYKYVSKNGSLLEVLTQTGVKVE